MIAQLRKTYEGKKIFLTGHTGFKGAWMLKVLSLLGAKIKGYSLHPHTDNDLFNLIKGENLCTSVIADIRDRDRLITEVVDFQPDFVFHFAAQPLVRLSYSIPSETFEVNAIGTANVLDAVNALEKKCTVIAITTDKVYHNNEWEHPYRESDRLGGYDPYSASKACAELLIDSYRNSFFNTARYNIHQKGLAVARAGNVIGGGDWSDDRLIPDVARAFGAGNKVKIRNPNSVRPWQHVLEPLIGYLILAEKLNEDATLFSEAFNFGPDSKDALPVKVMIDLATTQWEGNGYEIDESENELHEAGLLKLDISKALVRLGWKPKLNAEQAVRLTIDWYKAFYQNKDEIVAVTDEQIIKYLNA